MRTSQNAGNCRRFDIRVMALRPACAGAAPGPGRRCQAGPGTMARPRCSSGRRRGLARRRGSPGHSGSHPGSAMAGWSEDHWGRSCPARCRGDGVGGDHRVALGSIQVQHRRDGLRVAGAGVLRCAFRGAARGTRRGIARGVAARAGRSHLGNLGRRAASAGCGGCRLVSRRSTRAADCRWLGRRARCRRRCTRWRPLHARQWHGTGGLLRMAARGSRCAATACRGSARPRSADNTGSTRACSLTPACAAAANRR